MGFHPIDGAEVLPHIKHASNRENDSQNDG